MEPNVRVKNCVPSAVLERLTEQEIAMDKLLESARRNPDAIAIAVLCLVLGIGRQSPLSGGAAYEAIAPVGVHRIWVETVGNAVDTIRARLCLWRCPFD